MGMTTKIEWAHSTINLFYGCTKISPACDNCYAAAQVHRLKLGVVWNKPPVKAKKDRLAELRTLNRGGKRFAAKHGERRRIFVNSMSDFFDNQAPQAWRDEAFAAFEECTDVDILLVTKRPQNVLKMIPQSWLGDGWPPHVWLIVTAENQEENDRRRLAVRAIKFKCKIQTVGASIEPMLEYIDPLKLDWANWIIVGGESGKKARPMHPDWVSAIRDYCIEFGVPFHFKQWGQFMPVHVDDVHRHGYEFKPVGKKESGRRLHGETHDGFPVTRFAA